MKEMKEKKIIFQYTPGEDMSYIFLNESLREVKAGEAVGQIRIDPEYKEIEVNGVANFKGEFIIDVDKDGKVIGIEILGDVIPENLKK